MPTLSELQTSLTDALTDAAKAQKAYEDAQAKLEPLRQAAEEKQRAVDSLMTQYQKMRGIEVAASPRRRRSSGSPRKFSPEGRINISVGGKMRKFDRDNPKASEAEREKARAKFMADAKRAAK